VQLAYHFVWAARQDGAAFDLVARFRVLFVGDNAPYIVSDLSDYTIPVLHYGR